MSGTQNVLVAVLGFWVSHALATPGLCVLNESCLQEPRFRPCMLASGLPTQQCRWHMCTSSQCNHLPPRQAACRARSSLLVCFLLQALQGRAQPAQSPSRQEEALT